MKKFIKGLLIGILTSWIAILFILFGIVSGVKNILVDTLDVIIKDELKSGITEVLEDFSDEEVSEETIKEIEKQIDANPGIKQITSDIYDAFLTGLSGDEINVEIDVAKEVEAFINENEETLKEYGIELTEEEKEELLEAVSSSEINDIVNETLAEMKEDITDEAQTAIDIYVFFTGPIFKVILIGLIIVALVLIALLKKSYYGWLSNLGSATIIVGILLGVLLPVVVSTIITELESEVTISTGFLSTYGYILIAIGVVSLITYIILNKKLKPKNTEVL